MIKCFYHNDLDGKCAAAIVNIYHNEKVELHSIDYPNVPNFPWEDIQPDDLVYMVDFSLQPLEMITRLSEKCNLVWIDHHKSSTDVEVQVAPGTTVVLDSTSNLAGCELAWNFLYPAGEKSIPTAVRLLGDYDTWRYSKYSIPSQKYVLAFQYGMQAMNTDPGNADFWYSLLWLNSASLEQEVLNRGNVVLAYLANSNSHTMRNAHPVKFMGLSFLAVNHSRNDSKVFDSYPGKDDYDAYMIYHTTGWNTWSVHLYSTCPEYDMSAIAVRFGGGGHRGAAGFQLKIHPEDTGIFRFFKGKELAWA